MNFLCLDNQICVVFKNHNIKMERFKEQVKDELKKLNEKSSFLEEIYPVCDEASGIVVFALTSKAKERIKAQIDEKEFLLRSFAVCIRVPKFQNKMFYDDEKDETILDVRGDFVARSVKTKRLEHIPELTKNATNIHDSYDVLEDKEKISLVRIDGGFSFGDETRFVLFDAGSPVFGDKLYDGETLAKNTNLALCIVETRFVHPTTNKKLVFRVFPEVKKKPWSYFNVEKFLKI